MAKYALTLDGVTILSNESPVGKRYGVVGFINYWTDGMRHVEVCRTNKLQLLFLFDDEQRAKDAAKRYAKARCTDGRTKVWHSVSVVNAVQVV